MTPRINEKFGRRDSQPTIKIRAAAIKALELIIRWRKTSSLVLPKTADRFGLSGRDRSMFYNLVFGVLKNIIFLDYILLKLLSSGRYPSFYGSMALRLGAYQLAMTDIPHYAAVDSTMEALRSLGAHPKELALVNAVLRKFAEKWREISLPEDKAAFLSVKYSHPEWIVERWLRRYGAKMTEQILVANNAIPPKTFRINTLKVSVEGFKDWAKTSGYEIEDTVFAEYFNLLSDVAAGEFEPQKRGLVSVQDAAFGIPIRLLDPKPGELILEVGAAPGGKTTQIVEWLGGNIKNFFAIDNVHQRNLLIVENIERLAHPRPHIITADGTRPPFKKRLFDKVFIDAPCTSWGVVRRHPEIKIFRKEDDEPKLRRLQKDLVGAAFRMLKRGGLLVFTTCTTEPEENQGAVELMIKLGMKLLPVNEVIPEQFVEAEGLIARTWVHKHDLDGSFTVIARKE